MRQHLQGVFKGVLVCPEGNTYYVKTTNMKTTSSIWLHRLLSCGGYSKLMYTLRCPQREVLGRCSLSPRISISTLFHWEARRLLTLGFSVGVYGLQPLLNSWTCGQVQANQVLPPKTGQENKKSVLCSSLLFPRHGLPLSQGLVVRVSSNVLSYLRPFEWILLGLGSQSSLVCNQIALSGAIYNTSQSPLDCGFFLFLVK